MKLIPQNKIYDGSTAITISYDGSSIVNKAYVGSALTLVRFAEYPRLSLTVDELSFLTAGGSLEVGVKSNAGWTASTSASWLTISGGTSSGNGSFTVIAAENDTEIDREAVINVVCRNVNASVSETVSVSQSYISYEPLAYIENGPAGQTSNLFLIDTNYIPTVNTVVEISISAQAVDGGTIFSTQNTSYGWWRFFSYQNNRMFFDCPTDSNARIYVNCTMTEQNVYKMWVNSGNAYLQVGENTPVSGNMPGTPNFTTTLKLWGYDGNLVTGTKVYYIKIWEGETLAMDFVPARIGNDIGLFDRISGVLYTNQRSGQLTYGELS